MSSEFSLNTGPIDAETKAVALKELRETEENVKNGLEKLRQLLEADKSLFFKTDDDFLTIFLRPCKWYPESAYELMKRVAEFKEKQGALLDNLTPIDEKDAFLNHNVINVLKNRDHKRRRVMIVNCGSKWDPSKISADQMFRLFYMVHEAAVLEPESQVHGVVVIMDFEGLSMKQVVALTPSFSMRLLSFIQDAMPLRLKEVHYVNQPFMFNMVWQMFKPFVRPKLKARMFFHGSKMKSLHNHLAPSHLPQNYGGQLPPIDYTSAEWYPVIINFNDHMKEMNSYGFRKNE